MCLILHLQLIIATSMFFFLVCNRFRKFYPGVEHIGGDMFVSVPKADAIFMKVMNTLKFQRFTFEKIEDVKERIILNIWLLQWICHDWSDEHCLKFLKKCYEALPANGKVIIAECLLPEVPATSTSSKNTVQIDVIMLAHNPGGKERTEKEFEALAKGAGFNGFSKACCAYNTWVMEFSKWSTNSIPLKDFKPKKKEVKLFTPIYIVVIL